MTHRYLNPLFWYFKCQRATINPKKRELGFKLVKPFLPKVKSNILGNAYFEPDKIDVNQKVQDLKQYGYTNLGRLLSEEDVESIKSHLLSHKCHDPYNKEFGEFYYGEESEKSNVIFYKKETLLSCKKLIQIANDNAILNIVSKVYGVKPTLMNMNCWWSLAKRANAEHAQFFHRDVDDFKFLKVFIYLTDVGPNDGPHVYVQGSYNVNKCTEIVRYQDKDVEEAFGAENILNFTGEAGSMFIVDVFGVHKGLLPSENNRLLLQICYALAPGYHEEYSPIDSKTIDIQNLDPYINRCYIK